MPSRTSAKAVPLVDGPKTIIITDADHRELLWLRGSLMAFVLTFRILDRAIAIDAIKWQDLGFDFAYLMYLVEQVDTIDALDRVLAQLEPAIGGGR
jgi:hypothetical protein